MSHPLISYMKEQKKQGMSAEQVLKALTDSGWKVHDVVDIVLDHVGEAARETTTAPISAYTEEPSRDIITVSNLSKSYAKLKALDNVSLGVERGSVTALLGPNGAGKTTLVRILATLLTPTVGTATVAGYDVVRDAQSLRSVIGLAGQFAAVDETLTGRENLEMVGRLYHMRGRDAKARAQELLAQFDLTDAGNRTVKTYSGGMRRRLDLAASLVFKPKILFLDEPTTGLDPRSRFALWHVIRDLVKDGTTVLLTTQYLEEADQLANKIFVIDHGKIIAQGTADELKRQIGGDVVELHLASGADSERAIAEVKQFGQGEPKHESGTDVITMPVSGGASVLIDVVRALDSAKIKVNDVMMRRPSLDDVFMKLTGHSAE